jgi:hypothetical protein
MQQIFSKAVAAALALSVVATTSGAAQAHHRKKWHAVSQQADRLAYDYSLPPIIGYSWYGNCYLVEEFAPGRPYLVRVCPGR